MYHFSYDKDYIFRVAVIDCSKRRMKRRGWNTVNRFSSERKFEHVELTKVDYTSSSGNGILLSHWTYTATSGCIHAVHHGAAFFPFAEQDGNQYDIFSCYFYSRHVQQVIDSKGSESEKYGVFPRLGTYLQAFDHIWSVCVSLGINIQAMQEKVKSSYIELTPLVLIGICRSWIVSSSVMGETYREIEDYTSPPFVVVLVR